MSLAGDTFFLDDFALRQWDDPQYTGTRVAYGKAEFVAQVHALHAEGAPLVDGYAPFCKHLFLPNFVRAKLGQLAITPGNAGLLRCAYKKRRPEELAVLARWFPESLVSPVPAAKYIDIILYSREQLELERQDLPAVDKASALPDVPWGIIGIKAQDEPFETPMTPITMMRNALGRDQGGSGVPLNKEEYDKAADYWEKHAMIAVGE